jgi:hypothetical protein
MEFHADLRAQALDGKIPPDYAGANELRFLLRGRAHQGYTFRHSPQVKSRCVSRQRIMRGTTVADTERRVTTLCEQPVRAPLPHIGDMQVEALYRPARVGGDFFDFVLAGASRFVFLFLDVAGKRQETLPIAAALQTHFRAAVPELFGAEPVNEADGIVKLASRVNHVLLEAAGGVRCSPGFLACYDAELGTLTYINAGHIPALVRQSLDVSALDANCLPFGLFSHLTYEAQFSVLPPGASLLLVSKGVVEARAGHEEFGLERIQQWLTTAPAQSAAELCRAVLDQAEAFAQERWDEKLFNHFRRNGDRRHGNDLTAIAFVRRA